MNNNRLLQMAFALVMATPTAFATAAEPQIPPRGPIPFTGFDADGNGSVTREEFDNAQAQRLQQRSATQGQARGRQQARFQDIDRDGNGVLSREEVQAHHRERMQNRPHGGGGGPGMGGGMGGGATR